MSIQDGRRPLIRARGGEDYTGSEESQERQRENNIPKRNVVVEPVYFMYFLALQGHGTLMQEYLYSRFAEDYPILANQSGAENSTGPCQNVNVSDPYYIATQTVQEQASNWNMYLTVLYSLLSVFATVLYGAYSDIAGRRLTILLPSLATTVKFIFHCFIIYFELPVPLLLIGQIIDSLGGGAATLITSTNAYVADLATPEQLGLRLTILEGMIILSGTISQLALGYFIKGAGYFYPALALTIILILNAVYAVFFVPETFIRDPEKTFSVVTSVKTTFVTFADKRNSRHVKLALLTLSLCLVLLPLQARSISLLYVLNIPFCWSSVQIGIFSAAGGLSTQVAALIGLKVFKILRVPEIWITVAGIASLVASYLATAFAENIDLLIVSVVVAVFMPLIAPMFLSIISQLVGPDEQGKAFSGIACFNSLFALVGSIVMTKIYQKTLYFMKGFVFLVGDMFAISAIVVVVVLISLFGHRLTQAGKGDQQNRSDGHGEDVGSSSESIPYLDVSVLLRPEDDDGRPFY